MSEPYKFPCPNCGTQIEEKTLRPGQRKRCRACHQKFIIPTPPADPSPYGLELAERVADYLQRGGEIPNRHPYFYGVCLAYCDGKFLCGYAADGGTPAFVDATAALHQFAERGSFVSWLAAQSDATLTSETGPITRQMLVAAVAK